MQFVVSRNDAAITTRALVVTREHGQWWVAARYG
jgi:hypothetical protein